MSDADAQKPVDLVIIAVCTDRGQHPMTMLGDIYIDPDGAIRVTDLIMFKGAAERRKHECVWFDSEYQVLYMRCVRCSPPREVRWGHKGVLEVAKAWAGTASSLDISSIP